MSGSGGGWSTDPDEAPEWRRRAGGDPDGLGPAGPALTELADDGFDEPLLTHTRDTGRPGRAADLPRHREPPDPADARPVPPSVLDGLPGRRPDVARRGRGVEGEAPDRDTPWMPAGKPDPASTGGPVIPPAPPPPRTATARTWTARPWTGSFTTYAVADPGRAAGTTVPIPDPRDWDHHDIVVDGVALAGADGHRILQLRAASVRGLAHRHSGTVRQDAYAFRLTADARYLVAAVADGVSSAALSHHASDVVARAGCAAVAAALDTTAPARLDWPAILGAVGRRVLDRGRHLLPGDPTDSEVADRTASTALYAVVELERIVGTHAVHVQAVGDSSAWVLQAGAWEPLGQVKNAGSAVASSATAALPHVPRDLAPPVFTQIGPGCALVLMTDGVGDPLGDGTGEVGAFLGTEWVYPPAPLEFAAQVDFAMKSFDDDRTALAVWPQPAP